MGGKLQALDGVDAALTNSESNKLYTDSTLVVYGQVLFEEELPSMQ